MSFRITGLDFAPFRPLVGLSDDALRAHGARRVVADRAGAFPDRIELRDAEPGEPLILVNHVHQPADSPYRASHAVFVLEHAGATYDRTGEIPALLRRRMISLRAFDDEGMIVGADLRAGRELEAGIAALFERPGAAYMHLHYAAHGCFACRVDRALP